MGKVAQPLADVEFDPIGDVGASRTGPRSIATISYLTWLSITACSRGS